MRFVPYLLGLLIATVPACHGGTGGKAKVVTTLFPVHDLTRRIAGEDADVLLLVPESATPGGFTPGPDVEQQVTGARLAVVIGSDMDPWLSPIVTRVAPSARVLRLADRVPTLPRDGKPSAIDVHVWLDPQRALLMSRAITDELCRVDPAHATGYRTRALDVTHSLEALDHELETKTAGWSRRAFVTAHDDFRYYADRYHLVELGVGRTGDIALPPRAVLDAVGGAAGAETYEALLRWDTDVLEKALADPPAEPPGANSAGH